MTNKQKKDFARTLYLLDNLTQKEISERTGIQQSTLSKWINGPEQWDKLKVSILSTKRMEINRMYLQLKELNDNIANREEGCRYPNSKEADTLNKISAAIRNMETDTSVSEVIAVAEKMTSFVRKEDLAKAKELTILFDEFIKHLLK